MAEMICPKAKECKSEIGCNHYPEHKYKETCRIPDRVSGCPACIPYIPEQEYECTSEELCVDGTVDKSLCFREAPCPYRQPKKPAEPRDPYAPPSLETLKAVDTALKEELAELCKPTEPQMMCGNPSGCYNASPRYSDERCSHADRHNKDKDCDGCCFTNGSKCITYDSNRRYFCQWEEKGVCFKGRATGERPNFKPCEYHCCDYWKPIKVEPSCIPVEPAEPEMPLIYPPLVDGDAKAQRDADMAWHNSQCNQCHSSFSLKVQQAHDQQVRREFAEKICKTIVKLPTAIDLADMEILKKSIRSMAEEK